MGTNWSVTDGVFTLFGQEGFVSGRNWVVRSPSGVVTETDLYFEPRMDSVIAMFIKLYPADGEEIAYVGVSPGTALKLIREELLTEKILEGAEETPDTITVTLPFGRTNRKVVILKDLHENAFAIFDKDGQKL
jgi:hypothetical protein